MVIVLTWPVTVITEVIGVGVHVEEGLGSEGLADEVDKVEGVWDVCVVLGDGAYVVVSGIGT